MNLFQKRARRILAIVLSLSFMLSSLNFQKMTVEASEPATFNGLSISFNDGSDLTIGTDASSDVYSSGAILYINTNKPVTVSGTTSTATLAVTAGTQA